MPRRGLEGGKARALGLGFPFIGGFAVRQSWRFGLTRAWPAILALALFATPALAAGPYVRLQVLVPGETAAPGTPTGRTGTPRAQTAGIPFTVTVRACDSQWNTVTSVGNIIGILASDPSATLPPAAQLNSGVGTFPVTFNTGGSFNVYAHDQSDGTIPDGTSSAVANFVLQGFKFSKIKDDNWKAGEPIPVTLTAIDPNGNTAAGFNGSVNLKQTTSFGDGFMSPTNVALTNGVWSGSLIPYRADETDGRLNVNFFAWLASNPNVNGTSDPFKVKAGSFARMQVVVPGQTRLSGSPTGLSGSPVAQIAGQAFSVTVVATDNWWNDVDNGDRFTITSSDGAANTPVNGKLSHGWLTVSVTLNTVGDQTLTVTDTDRGGIVPMTSVGIPVIPNNVNHFRVLTIASPQVAGAPVAVTIRAEDASNNVVTNFTGSAALLANTGQGTIAPELVTFSGGVWTGPMVFKAAGSLVSFNCSDFAATPHTGASNSFQVVSAAFAGLQVLLPGETVRGGTPTGKSGTPATQSAGNPFTLTVRAVDDYWNLVSGVADRVALGSSDAFALMPAETTLVNGQVLIPVRLHKSGSQRLWASDVDQPSARPDTSSWLALVGGTFTRLLILAPGESVAPGTVSGRAGTATDQSVGYAFDVTVLATDPWWNPVPGISDVVHLSSTDGVAILPPDAPLADGRADLAVRLGTGGFQQITASDVAQPAKTASTTQVKGISGGFHLEATVSPASVQAGEPFTLTVRVTNDAGAVIQEINSSVTITVQNASTGAPGSGTLLTARFQLLQGQRSVSETYTFAEPIVLVATDDLGNGQAVTTPVTVTPGPPAAIQLASDPAWVGGHKHATVTARLVDDYDNGIADQPMSFLLVQGTGVLTPVDGTTDPTGAARADFQGPRQSETDRIRAQSNAVTAELDVQTSLVDPSAAAGYVSNFPNPFHPPTEPTTIAYKLSDDATVTLRVFTLSGDLVRREVFARGAAGGLAGLNEWVWDGRNGDNKLVASGGYIVLIEAQGTGETLNVIRRKVAVVR